METDGTAVEPPVAAERVASRRRRTASDWQALLERWAGTGEPASAFCLREEANLCQFYAWRRRLQVGSVRTRTPVLLSGGSEQNGGFVEAVVVANELPSPSTAARSLEIVLLSGRRVRVTQGFDEELLKRVVRTLEAI